MIREVGVYTFCYMCNIFLITFDFTICWFQLWFVQPCEKIKGMLDFSICFYYMCNICDNVCGLRRDYDLWLMKMEYMHFWIENLQIAGGIRLFSGRKIIKKQIGNWKKGVHVVISSQIGKGFKLQILSCSELGEDWIVYW